MPKYIGWCIKIAVFMIKCKIASGNGTNRSFSHTSLLTLQSYANRKPSKELRSNCLFVFMANSLFVLPRMACKFKCTPMKYCNETKRNATHCTQRNKHHMLRFYCALQHCTWKANSLSICMSHCTVYCVQL